MNKILSTVLSAAVIASMAGCSTPAASKTSSTSDGKTSVVAEDGTKSEGVMTYAEYVDAAVDSEVTVETYVQAKQGWWEDKGVGKATLYTQDQEGAYFLYDVEMSEEDYNKLTEGTKIKAVGYKSEWSGEVEITDATFEIEEGNYIAEPYGSPYNEKDESDPSKLKLLSFKGYNRLNNVSECFEYCDINFMNKNLFNDINLQDGNTKTIKIENMFDCRNLQYIHKDTFAPISNKYYVFLFNGSMEDGYLRRCEYIRIYDDISELSEVNMHSLIFGNSDENSIVNELCGFNIINSKLNFNNLFTDKTKSITSIENVCTNIDQNNITNNICIGIFNII